MSQENVEIVRRGYERFRETGQRWVDIATPDFVWDMSNFGGWTEQPIYAGAEGAQHFLDEWTGMWDDWELELDELHDAGENVVAIVRQRGRSKAGGVPVEMCFAQVWTVREGKEARMEMYSDPREALKAVGLEE